jgi:D-alanyl-D-alanine carboxypeptidase
MSTTVYSCKMLRLSRRRAVVIGLLASLLRLDLHVADAEPVSLDQLLAAGLARDPGGALLSVFDLDPSTAAEVLQPATQADALPDGYAPSDLVNVGSRGLPASGAQLIRALILEDTRALIEAARAEGHDLYVGSGFRSQAYQVAVFAAQTARWGDADTANRYSARPGHSQHQLGTTIDFTVSFRDFRGSPAAMWLQNNAHEFGFVLPYTPASVDHTGYVDEPWHVRWVGASLAARLQSAGYQTWPDLTADDAINWLHAQAMTAL